MGEAVELALVLALLAVGIPARLDEIPEGLRKLFVQRLDAKHNVQVPRGAEILPHFVHGEHGGRAADEHVAVGVVGEVRAKLVQASYHRKVAKY